MSCHWFLAFQTSHISQYIHIYVHIAHDISVHCQTVLPFCISVAEQLHLRDLRTACALHVAWTAATEALSTMAWHENAFKRQSKRNLELNRKVFICEYEWIYCRCINVLQKMCPSFRLTKSPSHNDVSNGRLGNTFWLRTAGCKLLWHAECMSQVERYSLSAVCPFRESTFELYLSAWRNKSSVQRLWRIFHAKLQIFKAIRNISQSNWDIWKYINYIII